MFVSVNVVATHDSLSHDRLVKTDTCFLVLIDVVNKHIMFSVEKKRNVANGQMVLYIFLSSLLLS